MQKDKQVCQRCRGRKQKCDFEFNPFKLQKYVVCNECRTKQKKRRKDMPSLNEEVLESLRQRFNELEQAVRL